MANLLKRFDKQVIGSDNRIYDFLPKITASGDFKRVKNIDVIISSWNNILTTRRQSFLFDPEYGSDLPELIFDPVDDTTIERIKTEVEAQIRTYDDRATITDIQVRILPQGKGFTVDVFAEYQGEDGVLSVKFDDSTVLPGGPTT
jgi:phage baseplate assembly protein W